MAWNLSCTHRPLCSLFTSQLSAKPIPEQAVWQIHFPPLRIWSPSSSWASDTGSVRRPIGGPVPLPSSSNASSARSRVDSKSLRQNGNQEFCIKSNLPRRRKIYILELTKNGCPKRSVVTKGSCTYPITERSLHKTYSRLFFFSLPVLGTSFLSRVFGVRVRVSQLPVVQLKVLWANVSMYQTNSGKSPKFVFPPTLIFCSPICSYNFGVVFL